MRNSIIYSLTNNNINKKKYINYNIYQMESLTNLETYVKPALAAGAIYTIDKLIVKNPNNQQTMALAGGIAGSFLIAKLAQPYLPNMNLNLSSFGNINSQVLEARILEIGIAGGTLYGLSQQKIINLPTAKNDLLTLGVTILLVDLVSEEILPFLGYQPKH